jgi:methyl-accepting chemotaxis protein
MDAQGTFLPHAASAWLLPMLPLCRYSRAGEVSQAVAQMDNMTQQNAVLVEQAHLHAESLQDQAGVLSDSVAVFRLARSEHASAPAAAMPRERQLPAIPMTVERT